MQKVDLIVTLWSSAPPEPDVPTPTSYRTLSPVISLALRGAEGRREESPQTQLLGRRRKAHVELFFAFWVRQRYAFVLLFQPVTPHYTKFRCSLGGITVKPV